MITTASMHDIVHTIFFKHVAGVNLDKVLDSDGKSELHLGKIADAMTEWEGKSAEHLRLSPPDIHEINKAHPARLDLQRYEILYRNL